MGQGLNSPSEAALRTVRVRVNGGYQPPLVYARVGEPLRLVFSREETAACSEHVVFPAFGKSAMLPPFEDVAIDFVPDRAGEFEFTCQLGMLHGRLLVEDGRESTDPPPRHSRIAPRWTRELGPNGETMLLALLAWVCSLPVLLLLSVPFIGWRVGGLLALTWLGIVAAVCFAVCAQRVGRAAVTSRSRHAKAH